MAGIGCQAHRSEVVDIADVSGSRLAFLGNGTTTRETVREVLGAPSHLLEGGRILTYRLDRECEVVQHLANVTAWDRYSLILIFDENGFLERHRLLRIR